MTVRFVHRCALSLCLLIAPLTAAAQQQLYVASYNNDQVKKYDPATGAFLSNVNSGSELNAPIGLAAGPGGDLFVASETTDNVLRYDGATGAYEGVFAQGALHFPQFLTFGPDGDLFVTSIDENSMTDVLRFDGVTGAPKGVFVPEAVAGTSLAALTIPPNGELLVGDGISNQVDRYNGATGTFIGVFASVNQPGGLAFGAAGDLFVPSGDKVFRFDGVTGAPKGAFISNLPGPFDLAFGPGGDLFIACATNVLRYDGVTGAYEGIAASGGGLDGPIGIVFVPEPCGIAVGFVGAALCLLRRRSTSPSRAESI